MELFRKKLSFTRMGRLFPKTLKQKDIKHLPRIIEGFKNIIKKIGGLTDFAWHNPLSLNKVKH